MIKSLKICFVAISLTLTGCKYIEERSESLKGEEKAAPRLAVFVGVDVSGSFLRGGYFDDSINFLSYYIYAHLNGIEGVEQAKELFVGSIGGSKPNEPKTLYPIQTFQDKSVEAIHRKLVEIFPKSKENPYTDFNAFFENIAETIRNRKLILRPIAIVMVSDGIPDAPGFSGEAAYRKVRFNPLESLSRNITVRLLFTNANVGSYWRTKVPRKRMKVWTQDAKVMTAWKEPNILNPALPFREQTKFFSWLKDNVDFGVGSKRVN